MKEELVKYIESEIIPRYENFDAAHGVAHVRYVIDESLRLAQYFDVDVNMVYAIAAYHDTGLCEGRATHHVVSGRIVMEDEKLKAFFSDSQLQTMRDAVEDHRASNEHAPRSVYGCIVAEADRQIDPMVTIRRTIQYGLSHYPELGEEEQYERMLLHLHEKYAEGGYLKLYVKQSSNAERLAQLRKIIVDEEQLNAIFCRIYAEETEA